jgi:hypothetical protein
MADWYHLISFTIVSLFLICLITRPKARHVSSADRQESSMAVQRVTAGTDQVFDLPMMCDCRPPLP